MAAPCFSDTDCIQLTFNNIDGLQANPIFDPGGVLGGGLECRPEGMSVRIFDDPANVAIGTDQDCQLLRCTTTGDLYATRPGFEHQTLGFDGAPARQVDFLDNDAFTNNSVHAVVTNLGDCARLVLATVMWQFAYRVPNVDNTEYESDGRFVVDYSGIAGFPTSEDFEIAGVHDNIVGGGATTLKHHSQSHTSLFTIPAGAMTTVTTYGVRSSKDRNVDGSVGGSVGLTAAVSFMMLDLAPKNLFSVV